MKEKKLNIINIKDGRTGTMSKRSWDLCANPDGTHGNWELADNIDEEKIPISKSEEIIVEQIGGSKEKIPINENKKTEKQYPLDLSVREIAERIKNDAFSKEELAILSTDERKSVVKLVIPKLK